MEDVNSMKAYQSEVEQRWGQTKAYTEFSNKTKNYSKEKLNNVIIGMDDIIKKFSLGLKDGKSVTSQEVQNLVAEFQKYITDNYYECTNEILAGLGKMYVVDERFKKNMDKYGDGTAEYISSAIKIYCN